MADRYASTNPHHITATDVGISLRKMIGLLIYEYDKNGLRRPNTGFDVIVDMDTSDPSKPVIRTDGNKHFKLSIEEI